MTTSARPLNAMDDAELAAYVAKLQADRDRLAAEVSGYHGMLAQTLPGDPPRGTVTRRLAEAMSRRRAPWLLAGVDELANRTRKEPPPPESRAVLRWPPRPSDWEEPTDTDPIGPKRTKR